MDELEENPEHDFVYQFRTLAKAKEVLTREDLQPLLEQPAEWMYGPIGTLVRECCEYNKISVEDAKWLRDSLPEESFARNQVVAFLLLKEEPSDWRALLEQCIALNAYWATDRVVLNMPFDLLEEIVPIVETARQRKRLRVIIAARKNAPQQIFVEQFRNFATTKRMLTREELQILLEQPVEWMDGAIGTLIKECCMVGNISLEDAKWLYRSVPKDNSAWQQLELYIVLKEDNPDWKAFLERCIAMNSYWVIEKAARIIPFHLLEEMLPAMDTTEQSKRLRRIIEARKRS